MSGPDASLGEPRPPCVSLRFPRTLEDRSHDLRETMWLADATGVNAHRDLLRPVLAAALVLLVVGLPSGVALSATDIPQIDRPDASFQAEVRSFQAEVRSFQERQRTSKARGERPTPRPALLADIPHDLPITTRPGKGKVIGRMPVDPATTANPSRHGSRTEAPTAVTAKWRFLTAGAGPPGGCASLDSS